MPTSPYTDVFNPDAAFVRMIEQVIVLIRERLAQPQLGEVSGG